VIENRTEEKDPQDTKCIFVTVFCHVYYNCNGISTFTVCQTDNMQYNADTQITYYTSSALFFCAVRRLAVNKPVQLF